MIVNTANNEPCVIAPRDLKSFKLVHAGERDPEGVGRMLTKAGAGYTVGDFAWIYEAWLRRAAGNHGAEWKVSFDAMLEFARSKCWFDENTAAVRAHIEWGSRD